MFPRRTLVLGGLGTAGLAASSYTIIRVFELANPPFATRTGHASAVSAVAFSPDGTTPATGGTDKTIRLWRIR